MTTPSTPTTPPAPEADSEEKLGTQEKFLLLLFVLGFFAFGLMLMGDLILALWR